MTNAVRHAYKSSEVKVAVGLAGPQVTMSVTNRGDEIPAPALDRIFERFFRVDHGRARGDGGTGLGLAIVRSIAKLHHGTVTVRSSERTTTFTLALPSTTLMPKLPDKATHPGGGRPEHVLAERST